MIIDDIRRAKNRRPFAAFTIVTADGGEVKIRHPDAVAWEEEDDPSIVLALSGSEQHWIEVSLITRIVIATPAPMHGESGGPS